MAARKSASRKSPMRKRPSKRRNTRPVDPGQLMEAVHDLMHRFDSENHDRCLNSDNERGADDLEFTVKTFGYLQFGDEFAELLNLTTKLSGEVLKCKRLKRFEYEDRRVLQKIVTALHRVEIHVPDKLDGEIKKLQAGLFQRAE